MKRAVAAAVALMAACGAAWADPVDQWRALTRGDVEAAHRLLLEDHPGTTRAVDNAAFRASLERAHRDARRRANDVENYNGYVATMAAFANAMGDRHIWSRPLYRTDDVNWAGLITARRGDAYIVVTDERGEEAGPSLVGASLVSCDGVSVADFAAAKLGEFRGVWTIEAQRVQTAPLLLVDDGNPFVLKPSACVFKRDGADTEITFNWRSIARASLRTWTRSAMNIGAAGYGVRDFAGGVWIALQQLDDDALPVAQAVRDQAERLRAAPLVVLDLRGNGGGNSSFAEPITIALFGQARYDAIIGQSAETATCDSVWRVSPRNIAQLRAYREQFASSPDFVAEVDRMLAAAEEALRAGRELSGDPRCGATRPQSPPADAPAQAARGRIVLLTDNACFSSCLMVADDFRRLGALHVGTATNANTNFSEVREFELPSGLSMFSTLQALMPQAPPSLGPYEPSIRYDGDMADTAALEAWLTEIAAD